MMLKQKLSPEQLEEKKRRDQLTYISNKVRGAWAFGQLKVFKDLLHAYAYPKEAIDNYTISQQNEPLTFQAVKDFISDRHIELETELWLKHNPPNLTKTDEELALLNANNTQLALIRPIADALVQLPEEDRDYEIPHSKRDKSFLFWFQRKAVAELWQKTVTKKMRATMLISGTGSGKTFMIGAWLVRLLEYKVIEGRSFTPWPIVYITKAAVVEQTQRVLLQFFGLTENDVLVINIDQLRAQFGKRFVREEITVEDGKESVKYVWRKNVNPIVMIWDECQALKNEWSQQSQIGQSFNDIDAETIQVFLSATPGTKVSEFKCFTVATRVPYTYGVARNAPMCNEHWSDFARNIANDYGRLDTKPFEHSPAAVDRLMDYLDDYIIRVKGIKSQFKAINSVKLLDFRTDKARREYENSWEDFQKKKAKIEGDERLSSSQAHFNILAQLTIFRLAAESNDDRIDMIGEGMYDCVENHNQAAVAVFNFKLPICKLVKLLTEKYKVPRSKISLIWGGAPVDSTKKKEKVKQQKAASSDKFREQMEAADLDYDSIGLDDIDLDEIEEKESIHYDPSLRLGPQSAKERQKEIDRFQRGESLYCIYTFRAGGVGLSLHHCDELTKEKVRRKKSGYAVEEDIPRIPTRQRVNFVAPTYSAIELVQGLGRCPRLTSLSDSPQILMFFRGTIEERVAYVVSVKLKCLTKVVRTRESWEDVMVGQTDDDDDYRIPEKHLKTYEPDEENSAGNGFFADDEAEEETVEVM